MEYQLINQLITEAVTEARTLNVEITVSIVDLGGHLMALYRMEGCSFFGIEASHKKAVTASQLKMPTHILAEISQKVPELQNALDKDVKVLTLSGGFPIKQNGRIVAGLGISGGDFQQDKQIGEKALQAMQ